jgi:ribosomal protein S18 acetylase RimI-like enzyme
MNSRKLTSHDTELVCRHREEMFREAGRDEITLQTMAEHFRDWLRPRLSNGTYFGHFLLDGETPVAGIGLMAIEWPPHPSHPTQDKRGYVLNVYVEKSHRRLGLGRELMALAEESFRERNLQFAILHATEQGRSLYESLGWGTTTEMSKLLSI